VSRTPTPVPDTVAGLDAIHARVDDAIDPAGIHLHLADAGIDPLQCTASASSVAPSATTLGAGGSFGGGSGGMSTPAPAAAPPVDCPGPMGPGAQEGLPEKCRRTDRGPGPQ
jgi:hypothetical protein